MKSFLKKPNEILEINALQDKCSIDQQIEFLVLQLHHTSIIKNMVKQSKNLIEICTIIKKDQL